MAPATKTRSRRSARKARKGKGKGQAPPTSAGSDVEYVATDIHFDRKALLGALRRVAPAVSKRATLPILSHVHIDASLQRATLTGTDLELTASTTIAATGRGRILLEHRALTAIVRECRDDQVRIHAAHGRATVTCGTFSAELPAGALSEWVQGHPSQGGVVRTMDTGDIAQVRRVLVAVSTDSTRPTLCGVRLDGTDCAGTDAYRLHWARLSKSFPARTVPRRMLDLATKTGAPLRWRFWNDPLDTGRRRMIQVSDGDTTWTMGEDRGAVEYPNWRKMRDTDDGLEHGVLEFDPAVLSAAVKRLRAIAGEANIPLRLTPADGKVTHLTLEMRRSFDDGVLTERIGGSGATGTLGASGVATVAFNPEYLAAAIDLVDGPLGHLETIDALKPGFVRDPDDDSFWALVMPVRIS